MANNKYLDYPGLQRLVENINKKYAPIQAIVFQSTVEDIAALPDLTTVKAGYMYNIKTGGITTEDFVEGAGHIVTDGENIAAVELVNGYEVIVPAASDDPRALGYYEVESVNYVNVTATLADDANPKALGLYEETLTPGTYVLTEDETVQDGKAYFEQVKSYVLTEDRLPVAGHTYYKANTGMKWDILGGVFDLEGRYLEFGKDFPQKPESRMVNGRTFLFMGEDRKVYTFVEEPTGRPTENGYFEGVFAIADTTNVVNPKQVPLYEQTEVEHYSAVTPVGTENPKTEGWYERTGSGTEVDPYVYTATEDTTLDTGKTYYQKDASTFIYARTTDAEVATGKTYYTGTFTASEDTTVDPTKQYYTESVLYKKGGIYEYDATAKEWELQSSGGAEVESIPLKDIDDLFI